MLIPAETNVRQKSFELLQALILLLFSFPLFFQLSGMIFTAPDAVFDSQGSLFRLPLPIASVICFVGIALLLRIEDSYFGTGFVFSLFMLMMLGAIFSARQSSGTIELAKIIHLVQFVLPSFALVLGRLYLRPASVYLSFEAIAVYILAIIVPTAVIATMFNGNILTPKLGFFSLYQHFEYLPVIFLGLYFFAASSFYESSYLRRIVLFLAPWMGIYVFQSLSVTTLVLAIYGSIVLIWVLYNKNAPRYAVTLIVISLVATFIYVSIIKDTVAYTSKFAPQSRSEATSEVVNGAQFGPSDQHLDDSPIWDRIRQSSTKNLRDRVNYWHFYGIGIFESPEVFLFGHKTRPDRSKYPSAHNYYLDLIYNFGAISILPFMYLIFVSVRRSWSAIKNRKTPSEVLMLAALVAFFVIIDNSIKVGFSQPYPGMVMFFFWGILFARLGEDHDAKQLTCT